MRCTAAEAIQTLNDVFLLGPIFSHLIISGLRLGPKDGLMFNATCCYPLGYVFQRGRTYALYGLI